MQGKSLWTSKTFWTNILIAAWAFVGPLVGVPTLDPSMTAGILVIVNLILRAVTKSPIVWEEKVPSFLGPLIGLSILSAGMAQGQTWQSKTIFPEPDFTVGLLTLKNNTEGNGVVIKATPGIGIGLAVSRVSSSNGKDWDLTDWSIALDPIYFERDETGSLFWVPGVKGTAVNEYLQLYVGVKVGTLPIPDPTFSDRLEVKFGTNLPGVWEFVTDNVF